MKPLKINELHPDPLEQFSTWFDEANATDIVFPNAMALATAGLDGIPSVRMVLLRGFDQRGLRFFTNYESHKGQQLAENPRAALMFYWGELDRQVRIQATTEKLSEQESDAYFASRPHDNQISAWASRQSQPITNRAELENRFEIAKEKYGMDVPRPPYWGGYLAKPWSYEFWQAHPGRLHDRFIYTQTAENTWQITRLAP